MFKAKRTKEKKSGRFKEARHAPPAHRLTRAEKKQIAAILSKTQRNHSVPHTAQETIPYQQMYPDGICRVTDNYYTKAILFLDINFELARDDDKETIIDGWSDILNACDSSLHYQFHYVDVSIMDGGTAQPFIRIADPDDGYNSLRHEYDTILQPPQSKDQHDIKRAKHLIFGVHADSLRDARPILERTELDLLSHFKRLGVWAEALDGVARLRLMHTIFHMEEPTPFAFDWRWLAPSGLSTKDFIAPSSFDFRDSRSFRMGAGYGAVSCYMILAPELKDRVLTDLLAMDSGMVVSCHVDAIDQVEAIKRIKRKLTDLDAMKITEQKKAVRSGYDMDVLPSDLTTYGNEAKKLLEELQSHNERLFLTTLLVMNTAASKRQLESRVKQAQSIAQQHNCALIRLDYQQEAGMVSCLPLGLNQIEIKRSLTTSALAIFVPFTTQELCQTGGEALYYGKNALSRNPIMADRKLLKNANGLILGTPGSGKSFAAKREITNAFLMTNDDLIICDPESEYTPLVQRLHGQIVHLSPISHDYINPMDMNMDYSDDENPLSLKADFVLSLCELIVGGKEGLQPIQKTIIDRCVRLVYQPYLCDPKPENMPILEDLYNLLCQQEEKEARYLATALEIYVKGSLNLFNHHTTVNINNRIVCYDIKELGNQLKKIGMLVVQDQVWNRVTRNRYAHKATRYYIDELHLLLKEEQTAAYTVEIWKRFRKWGGIPSGLTQNVKDLLASREIESILENSDFIYMLSQAQGDREILAQRLGISPHQLSYVTQSTINEAAPVIEKYSNLQYILTEDVQAETRYRTEQQTSHHLVNDPETGETRLETSTETVEVPYSDTICTVTLENRNLSHMPVYSMSHHTMGMYALYMSTHGNMEGIFAGNPYATALRDPWIYDIPQEVLDADPTFATLMEEANKYVGYPYVWGGASPETSFDCSGFVSWVFTNSGVYNTGRLGAKGLYGICRKISPEEAKPGDLVFFQGTMGDDVGGITHVGIYVGDHWMIHCGDPIGYADLTETRWVKWFHSYGRLPVEGDDMNDQ